ncbi:ABC transporter substrate-binding protein [Bifidobacterium vespertilionis]|uniref:Thiamine pyrimidine synthase n=1 Tax=Bifidobacterium vespertilionis TaxID=2562524 RepID=A0A5J5E0Q7_9BIFI|nr:ABC transporter substrate-binding protein [Bifidobacterium vespertilionis]KAA8820929.1 ABC transporter substrate-binding protein [Bifidobacterium vespertilionis]KAA8822685.1 ABC transporter substrate-binding protein [Bifidobacterium vespertilionis]
MKIMRKIVALAGAAAMALSLAACGGDANTTASAPASGSTSSSASKELKKVTFMLAWVPDTNHIGVYVAKNKGYFKDAGLDVDIIAVGQAGAEHAVSTGQADFALSNLTNAASYSLKGAGIIQTLQVQQKPSAVWCSLASNTAIKSPKDFDGKTFATFGSNESDAVIRRMIQADGGKGEFDKVTVGTNTFQTLSSGQADFGGFYATWEGVQAEMYGPKLNCFTEPDYGVPGNADGIGIITSEKKIKEDPDTVRAFTQAAQKGYEYAYQNPDEAAQILVDDAGDDTLKLDFVKRSMQVITEGQYWGDPAKIKDGSFVLGTNDFDGVQKYLDFIAEADAFTDASDNVVKQAPKVSDVSTNEFLGK